MNKKNFFRSSFRYSIHNKQISVLIFNYEIKIMSYYYVQTSCQNVNTIPAVCKCTHQTLQTDSSLCNDTLDCLFLEKCEWDRLALIKRLSDFSSSSQKHLSLSVRTWSYMCESVYHPLQYLYFQLSLMCMTQVQLLHLGQVLHVTSLLQMWLSSGQNLIYYTLHHH